MCLVPTSKLFKEQQHTRQRLLLVWYCLNRAFNLEFPWYKFVYYYKIAKSVLSLISISNEIIVKQNGKHWGLTSLIWQKPGGMLNYLLLHWYIVEKEQKCDILTVSWPIFRQYIEETQYNYEMMYKDVLKAYLNPTHKLNYLILI